MDMAVANLLKHKINFRLTHEENRYHKKKTTIYVYAYKQTKYRWSPTLVGIYE